MTCFLGQILNPRVTCFLGRREYIAIRNEILYIVVSSEKKKKLKLALNIVIRTTDYFCIVAQWRPYDFLPYCKGEEFP